MNAPDDRKRDRPGMPLWGPLSWLAFGVAILTFLTAIDRIDWFHIKPATGTAAAMSYAAEKAGAPSTTSRL